MFETISFLVALIGSSLAALFDVKITPTEIPNEIPYAMIALALLIAGVQSLIEFNYVILLQSLIYGISFLVFGYLRYKIGHWGGGDALVLAAIGFLSPTFSSLAQNIQWPFALSYLLNLFVIGEGVYMFVYAIGLALVNRKIFAEFFKNVKSSSKIIMASSLVLFLLFLAGDYLLLYAFKLPIDFQFIVVNSLILLFYSIFLFLLWKFVNAVNKVAFKKRIPVSKLKVGDILLESRVYEGITKKELIKIRRSRKKLVWIKEGVKFAPAFPLALLFTMFFGDSIFLFLKLLL